MSNMWSLRTSNVSKSHPEVLDPSLVSIFKKLDDWVMEWILGNLQEVRSMTGKKEKADPSYMPRDLDIVPKTVATPVGF